MLEGVIKCAKNISEKHKWKYARLVKIKNPLETKHLP